MEIHRQESALSSHPLAVNVVFFSSDCKDWSYGSEIKSTGCSFKVAAYDSQYVSSQLSVTQVLGDPVPPSGLSTVCTWYTNIYVGKTLIHIKIKKRILGKKRSDCIVSM